MKVKISIPIDIVMELDDVENVHDAKEQVKSICRDDPSIIVTALEDTDKPIFMTYL